MKRFLKIGCLGIIAVFVIIVCVLANANMSLLAGVIVFWLLARIVCSILKFILSTFIAIVIIELIINYII